MGFTFGEWKSGLTKTDFELIESYMDAGEKARFTLYSGQEGDFYIFDGSDRELIDLLVDLDVDLDDYADASELSHVFRYCGSAHGFGMIS